MGSLLTGFVVCLILLGGCQKNDNLQQPPALDEPKTVHRFCEDAPDVELSKTEFHYHNGNVVSKTSFIDGNIHEETTYTYNAENQLINETYVTLQVTINKELIYNEFGQHVNTFSRTTYFDGDGQITNEVVSEAPKEYGNNLLVKAWADWGGFTTYFYENGKKVKQISHTKAGEEHHITTYKYRGHLLAEEKMETGAGKLMSLKKYSYDSENRLTKIFDGEHLIEENIYQDNRLIAKRTYYFGIDPGFSACNGNFIYKYAY